MAPLDDDADPPGVLGRYTPDSRRWRLRVAGLAAVGAPLALYGAFAVASGVKSGPVYNLLILLFGAFSLVLPAVAAAALLAPDSGITRADASQEEDPVETLKRRYAAGEIDQAEFDRRLGDLLGVAADEVERPSRPAGSEPTAPERELDRAGR